MSVEETRTLSHFFGEEKESANRRIKLHSSGHSRHELWNKVKFKRKIDLIHDTRHLVRAQGLMHLIKVMARGFSGGKQVINLPI